MKEFLSDTSIHGIEFFEAKEKSVRRGGIFVFLLAFCGLGFFIYDMFIKWQVNPIIIEEDILVAAYDFPFPAVTICHPLFARDQNPNLREVLKNPGIKLSTEQLKILNANVQACAPNFAKKFDNEISAADMVKVLEKKFHHINDSFDVCFQFEKISCEGLLNYVITDYGFCFVYNLLDFKQVFNTGLISKDFNSYKLDDYDDHVHWALEEGYFGTSDEPFRSEKKYQLDIYPIVNNSDLNNLCPEQQKTFSLFIHMPNEILTPFHVPEYLPIGTLNTFFITMTPRKADEQLRHYSPNKRGCYFTGEKPLKFFKSYTKNHCEFECLSNRTLERCGCVKFSMPREIFTPICSLHQVSCYRKVLKNWSRVSPTCECLYPCTNIDYKIKYSKKGLELSSVIIAGHVFKNR